MAISAILQHKKDSDLIKSSEKFKNKRSKDRKITHGKKLMEIVNDNHLVIAYSRTLRDSNVDIATIDKIGQFDSMFLYV